MPQPRGVTRRYQLFGGKAALMGVNSVTAGDASIVIGGTATDPTVETGTLDVIATLHPPAGNWSNSSHKITSLANGSAAQDAAAYGQTLAGGAILTTLGDLLYENATPAPARLAGNTTATKKFLTQTGTGSVSAAPGWNTIVSGDLPAVPGSVLGLAPSGDTSGATDYTNIQGLLNLTGSAVLQAGLFYVNNMLQVASNSCLSGAGKGITTIRMASGSWSGVAQVGSINGVGAIITSGNTTASYIAIRDLTVDGNQTGVTAIPGWVSGSNTCAPLHLNSVTNLLIQNVEVINPIGYALYHQSCAQFTIQGCRVITGQVSAAQGWGTPTQQDAIHIDSCTYGAINGNYIDTGTFTTNVGDDGIALQSFSAIHDITISNNTIRSAEAGIDLALSGANIFNITITGNSIWAAQNGGVISQPFSGAGAISSSIAITNNTITNAVSTANNNKAAICLLDYGTFTTPSQGWADVTISGNTINGIANGYGVYARFGNTLAVTGNNFYNNALAGASRSIQIGDNISSTTCPVTDFTVSDNTVNCTAVTGTPTGIMVIDSTDGAVNGNVIPGPAGPVAGGIGIRLLTIGTNVTGITVDGNRVTVWATGIQEDSSGDFNVISSNQLHGCTAALSLSGSHDLVFDSSKGIFQGPTTLPAGTTSAAPLTLTSGTNLTSATAGAVEYDGVAAYFTNETTSGRGRIPVEQSFRLTSTGGTISTIANYFGTTSNISLVANAEYEIEIVCWFLKTTAGTVTWTFTNSAAPTSMTIDYQLSPATGIVTTAAATDLFGQQYNVTATAPTVVSPSLTSAVNHRHKFAIRLINGTGTSLKIQATASAGSITPGINSYWKARRVPLANVGTFAA